MNKKSLMDYLPKDKFDIQSIVKLYELNDDDIKSISDRLLVWMQDYNWPVAHILSSFLVAKQDLMIEAISKILKPEIKDECWKYWIVEELLPYFSLKNMERLYGLLSRISNSPTESEQREELDEDVEMLLKDYDERKRKCCFNGLYDTELSKRLYLLPDTDIHFIVRQLLENITRYNDDVMESIAIFVIAKQDLLVDDVVSVLISDSVKETDKSLLLSRITCNFSPLNCRKIDNIIHTG